MNRPSRLAFIVALAIIGLTNLGAQSNVQDFFGTQTGSQFSANTDGAPSSTRANPSAMAGSERPALELGYQLLAGTGTETGFGHWVNLGASLPTNLGVWTGTGRFATSQFPSLNLGTLMELHGAFSKDLYEDLYFGLGLGAQLGLTPGSTDWGLALDLGFIHKVGKLGILNDFDWGVAVKGLGKSVSTGLGPIPPAFNPSVGVAFEILRNDTIALGMNSDLSFPTFQNMVWKHTIEAELFDLVSLQVASDLDLRAILTNTARPLPLSFGLTARLGKPQGGTGPDGKPIPFYQNSEYQPSISFTPLRNGIIDINTSLVMPIGINDKKPPVAEYSVPDVSYISPNFTGIQDTLSFALSAKDERYIQSFTFTVKNQAGEVVRTIRNKEQRPEAETFMSLFSRFVRVKTGVPIPNPMVWDGNGDGGDKVADGTYTWSMEFIDDNGNTLTTEPKTVVVDTKDPELSLTVPNDNPNRAFAPNGDRPTLILAMSSSPEDSWEAQVLDSRGTKVRNLTWKETLPEQLIWDGLDNEGVPAPDGVYSIKLSSTDKSGNTSVATVDNVLLISEPTPVSLRVDSAHFSPNRDGIKDGVNITIDSNPRVRVDRYTIELSNQAGQVIQSQSGNETLPSGIQVREAGRGLTLPGSVEFDLTKDGQMLAEGTYTITLRVVYINGNRPSASTPNLVLDLSPPRAMVSIPFTIFSPNGDGQKDTLPIKNEASSEQEWKAEIIDSSSKPIRSFTWTGTPSQELPWDGKDGMGANAPDGAYTYQLVATDLAGNRGASNPLAFELDRRPISIEGRLLHQAFGPNNDGVKDFQELTLSLNPRASVTVPSNSAIATWSIQVQGTAANAQPIYTETGLGTPPETWRWTGQTGTKAQQGPRAADGVYRIVTQVEWTKGDIGRNVSRDFILDTTAPTIGVTHSELPGAPLFSPDGDGNKDTLGFIQTSSQEERWAGVIKNTTGQIIRTWNWNGQAESFIWDGADDRGSRVADGTYSYEVSATDAAGNSITRSTPGITISTKKATLSLNLGMRAFSPAIVRNGVRNLMTFTPVIEAGTTVATHTLEIVSVTRDGRGQPIETSTRQGPVAASLTWDGLSRGSPAPEGEYFARLSITDSFGVRSTTDSLRFTLDRTAPVVRAWATTVSTFSPDGDGRNDRIGLTQETTDSATWTARIFNPARPGANLRTWTWNGVLPSRLDWDGSTDQSIALPDGTYQYEVTGTDEAGNSATSAPLLVTIDTRQITLGLGVSLGAFSPNGDSIKDRLVFTPSASIDEGIASWTLEVRGSNGNAVVRQFGQQGKFPGQVEWDGRSAANTVVPDGNYRAVFTVTYLKGNIPTIQSDAFVVDTRAPSITLQPVTVNFSPDGDGAKDSAIINQTSSVEDLWVGEILSGTQVVRTFTWNGQTKEMTWDGKNQAGADAPDGTYIYRVRSEDLAGNRVTVSSPALSLDRRATTVRIVAGSRGFVPRSNNPDLARMSFQPIIDLPEGVESWVLSIRNEAQAVVRTQKADGLPQARLFWDGLNDQGVQVPDGKYEAQIQLFYTKGNNPLAVTAPFQVDTRGPTGTLGITPNPFSPDEDGIDDEAVIALAVNDPSDIREWRLIIKDPEGEVFTDFSGRGQPAPRIIWNGKSRTGELVQAALDYRVELSLVDSLGNSNMITGTIAVDVLVIQDGELLRIPLPGISFPANSANLTGVEAEKLLVNNRTLDRMAEILRRYSNYRIMVEGHANYTAPTEAGRAREQQNELLPLSAARADAVKRALIARGIPAARLEHIGVGGARPLVDFTDTKNLWKNRRVEFILRK